MSEIFSQIKTKINASQNILLLTHKKPDGDALGSLLAMRLFLLSEQKNVGTYLNDRPADYWQFLPGSESLNLSREIFQQNWDLVIVLDSGELPYTGIEVEWLKGAFIINMDHHWTNTQFGQINCVDETASSASEVVYHFFKEIDATINKNIATCLLNGILNDTGGLTNSATSESAVSATSDLTRYGARIDRLNDWINRHKTLAGLRLWGDILSRLTVNKKYSLAFTYVKEEDFKKYEVDESEVDGLVNFLNALTGVNVVMFLKIRPHEVKISFRTKRDDVNVADLAQLLGGGGHKKAAACCLPFIVTEQNGQLAISE
ncbi:MAG: bifunctional oligoribonuclease/PAP phosphatase NrnA [bacterium]